MGCPRCNNGCHEIKINDLLYKCRCETCGFVWIEEWHSSRLNGKFKRWIPYHITPYYY